MKQRDLEAKENWIAARVDELKCDNLFCIKMSEEFSKSWIANFDEYMNLRAKQQAEREHAELEHFLLEDKINMMEIG